MNKLGELLQRSKRRTHGGRLFNMFLTLCMVLILLPVSVMAEEVDTTIEASEEPIVFAPMEETEKAVASDISVEDLELPKTLAATEYNVWVGSVRVTSANADDVLGNGTVSYEADTKTLTLNGASITEASTDTSDSYGDKISIQGNELILNLVGENSITGVSTGTSNYGIKCNNLTIQGEGSLTVNSDNGGGETSAILTTSELTINGGTLNVSGKYCGLYGYGSNITINGGTVTVLGGNRGLYASRNIIINDGIVRAQGNNYGVLCYGNITINGGTVTAKGNDSAIGTWSDFDVYSMVKVTASSSYDGSSPSTYNKENITSYKYLAFEPDLDAPDVLTGTVTIIGTLKYGHMLTATYASGNNTGTLSYQWKRDGINIGTNSNTYTIVEADINQTLTCEVTSDIQTDTVSGSTSVAIGKADGFAVTGVSVVDCTTTDNNNGKLIGVTAAMEYKKSGETSYRTGTGSDITGLTSGNYLVRVAATRTHNAGADSTFTISAVSVSDKEKLAVTKKAIEIALKELSVSNRTTTAKILKVAQNAAKHGITIAWKDGKPATITLATTKVKGSIKGTLTLMLGSESAEVNVKKTIAKLTDNSKDSSSDNTSTVSDTNSSSNEANSAATEATQKNTAAASPKKSNQQANMANQNTKSLPYLAGEKEKSGWEVIIFEIKVKSKEKRQETDTIVVEMNGATVLPANVISQLQGNDISIVLDMGDGIIWTINGKDVSDAQLLDINLGVNRNANVIPSNIVDGVRGENNNIQIELAHNGDFGFTATLTIAFDKAEAGMYANLFYYNEETGELEYIESTQVEEDGNAELRFVHASAYTIVVSSSSMDGSSVIDNQTDTGNHTEDSAKTVAADVQASSEASGNGLMIWILLGIIIVVVIGGTIIYMRRENEPEGE